jgi:hypothetical protein
VVLFTPHQPESRIAYISQAFAAAVTAQNYTRAVRSIFNATRPGSLDSYPRWKCEYAAGNALVLRGQLRIIPRFTKNGEKKQDVRKS